MKELEAIADALGVEPRSVREWKRKALRGEFGPLGRPRKYTDRDSWSVLRAVYRVLEATAWSRGEGTVLAHRPDLPRRLVRWALRRIKSSRDGRRRRHVKRHRRSTVVTHRDAVWALDETHLGKDWAEEVLGLVVRDVATTKYRAVSVGPAATGRDSVRLLEAARQSAGAAALVLMVDNGSAMVCRRVVRWCRTHRVVLVRNLPRTPQHNAFAERAIGELKVASGLGARVRVRDPTEVVERLAEAVERIESTWPRLSRGGKTALALDRDLPRAEDEIDRTALYEAACRATEEAARNTTDGRARRKAVRAALLDVAEQFGVISRTGGGDGKVLDGGRN